MGAELMNPEHKIVEQEITGDVYINSNSQYNNLNADVVTVAENIKVRLFGVIKRRLVIGKHTRVYFHGSIRGEVVNLGGELHKH